MHTFGDAIKHIKSGGRVQRNGWHGKGMHVELDRREGLLDSMSITLPGGKVQPGWNASAADVFAVDWILM